MLNRSVKKINPIDGNIKNNEGLTFADILEIPNIVLLGEPGAGKSYLFNHASQHENGNCITARNFAIHADDTYNKKPVYIDALDEKRSRSEQQDSIGEIIRHIKQIKPSKVRLSCRVADWLGETDLELFKPYFEANGGYCVVVLEALTETEIDHILSGKNIGNPREFREKAAEKGVSTLLSNPQTLIMLADSVKNGQWPNTKRELYEIATSLLLTEHNDRHKHKPLAAYKPDQLKDAAGAACAALLIADVEGISLLKNSNNSYAEIPYPDSDAVLAALTKRAFVTLDQQQEQVTYSHRTVAEYLAACWLVDAIRKGLPIRRVCSLLCVDHYPAPELRGLYAWLAQLLSEDANALLASDPYGVLVLGDVSCLSLSSRKALLNALVKLSEQDPWFRAQDWTSEPLGALSTPEMANEFKAVLSRQPRQFHLRSVVLNAIRYGEQQPALKDELLEIFCDNDAPYTERSDVFEGLINAIPDGKHLVVKAIKEQLQISSDNLRLKEAAMSRIYTGHYNVEDVAQLVIDYTNHQDPQNHSIGGLWSLVNSLPLASLPELLDRLTLLELDESKENDEVWHFIYEILERTVLSTDNIDINRLWLWISKLKFSPGYSSYRRDVIKDWLSANQQHVIVLFNIALLELNDLTSIWGFWNNFQQLVRFEFDIDQIINSAFSLIAEKDYCNEKEQFIFELALTLTVTRTTNLERFNLLFNYACSHPELADVLSRSCQSDVPDWRWKYINGEIEHKKKHRDTYQKNRSDFEQELDLIRTGQHFGWLAWLANVYFARFTDVDRTLEPEKRLEQQLGEQNVGVALEGLQAVLNRNDLPTPSEIVTLPSQNEYLSWWFSILAGMSECWRKHNDFTAYSEQALKAALALNLLVPSFYLIKDSHQTQIKPDWQQALFQQNPELVQMVYLEIIEILLKTKNEYVPGIRDICQHPQLTHNRAAIVLRLLTNYPNAASQELETLLLTAISLPEIKEKLLLLTRSLLKPRTRVRLKQKVLWLSIGFLIDFEQFKDAVIHCAAKRESFIWTLISIIERVRSNDDKNKPYEFSVAQFDFIIRLVGKRFPDVEHPTGVMRGAQNPCDAADFVKRRINQLSTQIDDESVRVLNRLIDEPELSSYRDHLKHAAANQAALRREQHFDRPNWQQAIAALKNGKPANIADLHALTIEHLRDVASRARTENTDVFKSFWNEDSYGKITAPKVEETCRNRLIDLLRPKFGPLEINVEPEGHMVIDKRADIVLLNSVRQKLPIEIKRDYHTDLWTACENQLDRLYTRDPQAKGYGIYLVFWFGDKRPQRMRKPPQPLQKPNTAQELENALRSLIKADDQHRLAVVVIDVTRPED